MGRGHALGAAAEAMAAVFFRACGFTVLARRFRRPGGEIDLVVGRSGLVVFVEVKARRPSRCGTAVECVTARQLARLRRMARRFISENPACRGSLLRFDVVAIDFRGDGVGCTLEHVTGVG